jgi:hypothetical protein
MTQIGIQKSASSAKFADPCLSPRMTPIPRTRQDIGPALISLIRENPWIGFFPTQRNKKSRTLTEGTAPHKRDLQPALYRISSFASLIILDEVESFNSRIFLALCRAHSVACDGADFRRCGIDRIRCRGCLL